MIADTQVANEIAMPPSGFAGFWVRFFAACIDMIIFTPLYIGLNYALSNYSHWWIDGIVTAIAFAYYTFFYASKFQATPGMMLLKFHISDVDGNRISMAKAFNWCIGNTLGWLICFAGILYLQSRFDLHAVSDILVSCNEENIAMDDCKAEIEKLIGLPYESYQTLLFASVGLAAFLSLIWALSIALPKDKSGFNNILSRTRFVNGRR